MNMGKFRNSDPDIAARLAPTDLLPSATSNRYPAAVKLVLKCDIVLRCVALSATLSLYWQSGCLYNDLSVSSCGGVVPPTMLMIFAIEQGFMIGFLFLLGLWHELGHWITLWEVLGAFQFFTIRLSLYQHPFWFGAHLVLQIGMYFVALKLDISQHYDVRTPPFVSKMHDQNRPMYGWLGPRAARTFPIGGCARLIISFVLYVSNTTPLVLAAYVAWGENGTDGIPGLSFGTQTEEAVFVASIVTIFLIQLPTSLVRLVSLPVLLGQARKYLKSPGVRKQGIYESAPIDDDFKPGSGLQLLLAKHGKCASLTIIMPCYMPNEETIVFDVVAHYRKLEEQGHYKGEIKLLLVWNSPFDHLETVARLKRLSDAWPSLQVERNVDSTSKCDNLNFALGIVTTDMLLCIDADTIVNAGTMCRASMKLFGEGYDMVQCESSFAHEDVVGTPNGKCFPCSALTALRDATAEPPVTVGILFDKAPFRGRGGFWKTSALAKVGFDSRTLAEDFDSTYRGIAYFGFRTTSDVNMYATERLPPDMHSLSAQRIRWFTGGMELRRAFSFALRSPHYSRLECAVVFWSILQESKSHMPLQSFPILISYVVIASVSKHYIFQHVYLYGSGDDDAVQAACEQSYCTGTFKDFLFRTNQSVTVAFPVVFYVALVVIGFIIGLKILTVVLRSFTTRYPSRFMFLFGWMFLVGPLWTPFLLWISFWSVHRYLWGDSSFVVTKRGVEPERRGSDLDYKVASSDDSTPLLGGSASSSPTSPRKGVWI